MAPIYREHATTTATGRDGNETGDYLLDKAHAAPGEPCGPKVDFYGAVNGLTPDFESTRMEMMALRAAYGGDGEAFSHVSISLRPGEMWTPEKADQAVKIYLRHQGVSDHMALWSVHKDTKHHHIHIMTCRIKPEPNAAGKYEIAYAGGTICNPTSGHTLSKLSGHAAEAEIRAVQGWAREQKATYDWIDGKLVPAVKDPDAKPKNRLGSRVEAYEAHTGKIHPKTALRDAAQDVIRASGKDKAVAIAALAAKGMIYTDVDYVDNKGRRHTGGLITSAEVPKGIKLSALDRDCKWIGGQPAAQAPAQQAVPAYTMPVKASLSTNQSKGQVPAYAISHDVLSNVNALSEKVHATGGEHASKVQQLSLADDAKPILAAVLSGGMSETEMAKALAQANIVLTHEEGTDAKTGKTYTYGRLSRDGEKPISLRQLGLDDAGKPLYSLPKLDAAFLRADAAPILAASHSQGRTATAAALAAQGIALTEVSKTVKGEDGQEKTVRYGVLERNGVTVALGAVAKGEDGKKPLYSLGGLERADREIERKIHREAARAEALQAAKVGRAERAEVRAAAAQERAATAQERASQAGADAIQAGAEVGSDFHSLDFFQQIDVLRQISSAEAVARAATGRAADAERRASDMEIRAKRAEMSAQQPAPGEPKEQQAMADNGRSRGGNGVGGMIHAPAPKKKRAMPAEISADQEGKDKAAALAQAQADQERAAQAQAVEQAQAVAAEQATVQEPEQGQEQGQEQAPPAQIPEIEQPKKKGWLATHAAEARAAAAAYAAGAKPLGGNTTQAGQAGQIPTGPNHGPRQ